MIFLLPMEHFWYVFKRTQTSQNQGRHFFSCPFRCSGSVQIITKSHLMAGKEIFRSLPMAIRCILDLVSDLEPVYFCSLWFAQTKCVLHPSLNYLIDKHHLYTGCSIQVLQFRRRYDEKQEKALGPFIIFTNIERVGTHLTTYDPYVVFLSKIVFWDLPLLWFDLFLNDATKVSWFYR